MNLSCVARNRLNVPLFADPVNLSATTGVIFCGSASDGATRYRGVMFYCAWPDADTNNLPATVGFMFCGTDCDGVALFVAGTGSMSLVAEKPASSRQHQA
jgi:hypothetical protein